MKKDYVYDVETLKNCFTVVFKCKETGTLYKYVIHKSRNDISKLKEFLVNVKSLIGFNNVRFDSQIVQYIQSNMDDWIKSELTGEEIANRIYEIAQIIIQSDFPLYKKWEITIPQIDLFLILHLNNKARKLSAA